MANTRYEPDRAGFSELMHSPEMQAMCHAAAEWGQQYAEGIAPRDTGDYASSFRVESGNAVGGDRAGAVLVNDSDHAVLVEWVNGSHVLSRTAAAIESGA